MMRRTTWLGLSLMVLVSFSTSRLPAQEVFVVPSVPYEPTRHPYAPPVFAVKKTAPAENFFQRCLNKHGMNCGVDSFYPICGNWRYETQFIFGSCRSFFNESCPPGQRCGDKHGSR